MKSARSAPNIVHLAHAREGDAALEPFTSVRERDVVGRQGLFLAEGEVVVRVLRGPQSRFRTRALLLEERRVDALADVLPTDVPVYVVPQPVMDEVVGFPIHRGVLALGERGAPLEPEALLGPSSRADVFVAVVGLTNHDNVGGIFRNAAAFGAGGVLLDDTTCDPLYRKAIRVSAGAALTVPFARAGSADALIDRLEAAGVEPIALTPRGEETIEEALRAPGPSATHRRRRALVFGTEGPGLPDRVLARTRRVRIDMASGWDSLNVAVAAGVALHAARSIGK
jgi:tRNA G18 (ribose-2'-O)-methylase SpoU